MDNLKVVRYVIAIAETGSVSSAARRELVAQPSMSRQIRNLERQLGYELFFRTSSGLRLTQMGQQFVKQGREVVHKSNLLSRLHSHKFTVSDVSVAAPPQVFETRLKPAIMNGDLPLTSIFVRESDKISQFVADGEAQLGFSPVPPQGALNSRIISMVPVSLHIHRDVDPFKCGPLTLENLAEGYTGEIIMLTPERQTRQAFEHAQSQSQLDIQASLEVDMVSIAQSLAMARRSACIVSDIATFGVLNVHELINGTQRLFIPLYAMWELYHPMEEEIKQVMNAIANIPNSAHT